MPKGVYERGEGWGLWKRSLSAVQDRKVKTLYESGETQKEIANAMGVGIRSVRSSLRRSGTSTEGRKALPMEKNPAWKGGRRVNDDGYVEIRMPEHPYARHGYVLEHRLLMENKLGRYLLPTEVVHHRNKDKSDNRLRNLRLYRTNAEHLKDELTGHRPKWTPAGYRRMLQAARRKSLQAKTRRASSSSKGGPR